jgi:hypothetical protein
MKVFMECIKKTGEGVQKDQEIPRIQDILRKWNRLALVNKEGAVLLLLLEDNRPKLLGWETKVL